MQYGCVVPARFLARPNRFIARVRLGEQKPGCIVLDCYHGPRYIWSGEPTPTAAPPGT